MEKLEFSINLKGRITKVLEARGGTSARTGNAWKVQSFVLEECGVQHPQQITFEIFGEDNLNKFNIQEGCEYEVSVGLSVDEYNGKFYQKIRAWNVQALDIPKEQFAVPASPSSIVPTPQQAEVQIDFTPDEGDESSDLPF